MIMPLQSVMQRNSDGTFKRERTEWSLSNFDDGYVDNRGRFRVWSPNHPRSYKKGYILRSIVAYEAYHGMMVLPEMDIHHMDKNRLNDSEENLIMMSHGKHTNLHNVNNEAHVRRICKTCEKVFTIERWRLKDSSRGQFCSHDCFHKFTRNKPRPKMAEITKMNWQNPDMHKKRVEGLKKSWLRRKGVVQ